MLSLSVFVESQEKFPPALLDNEARRESKKEQFGWGEAFWEILRVRCCQGREVSRWKTTITPPAIAFET